VPSNKTDVNAALAAFQAATDFNRPELENELIQSLEHYATRIVAIKLHDSRPEIVNQAVQMALAQLSDFKGTSKFSTYFFTIVQNLCFGELRRKIESKETLFSDLVEHKVEGLASYELDGDERMIIDRICKTLSKDDNLLLQLKMEGYTNAEIALRLSSTASAIESRWRRLCKKLRKAAEKQDRSFRNKQRLNDKHNPN
jgi:RNA polymerase sigma factor (sigma-70 family)